METFENLSQPACIHVSNSKYTESRGHRKTCFAWKRKHITGERIRNSCLKSYYYETEIFNSGNPWQFGDERSTKRKRHENLEYHSINVV